MQWLLVLLTGCSFATIKSAPRSLPPDGHVPPCSTSRGAVFGDAAVSIPLLMVGLFAGLFATGAALGDDQDAANKYGLASAAGWVGATGFLISAGYGNAMVKRCKRLHEDAATLGAPMSYPPQSYPPQPYAPQPYPAPPAPFPVPPS